MAKQISIFILGALLSSPLFAQRYIEYVSIDDRNNRPFYQRNYQLVGHAIEGIRSGEIRPHQSEGFADGYAEITIEEFEATQLIKEVHIQPVDPDDPYSEMIEKEVSIVIDPLWYHRMGFDTFYKGSKREVSFIRFYRMDYEMGLDIPVFSIRFDELIAYLNQKQILYVRGETPYHFKGQMTYTADNYIDEVMSDLYQRDLIKSDVGENSKDDFPNIKTKVGFNETIASYTAFVEDQPLILESVPREKAMITSMSDALIKGLYVAVNKEELPPLSMKQKLPKAWLPDLDNMRLELDVFYEVDLRLNKVFENTKMDFGQVLLDAVFEGQLVAYKYGDFLEQQSADEVLENVSIPIYTDDFGYDGWGNEEEISGRAMFPIEMLFLTYAELYSSEGLRKGRVPSSLALGVSAENHPAGIDHRVCYFKFEDVYALLNNHSSLYYVDEDNGVGHLLNLLISAEMEMDLKNTGVAQLNKAPYRSYDPVKTQGKFMATSSVRIDAQVEEMKTIIPDFDRIFNYEFDIYDVGESSSLEVRVATEQFAERLNKLPTFDSGLNYAEGDTVGYDYPVSLYVKTNANRTRNYDGTVNYPDQMKEWKKIEGINYQYTSADIGTLDLLFEVIIEDKKIVKKEISAVGYIIPAENTREQVERTLFYIPRSSFIKDDEFMSIIKKIESNTLNISIEDESPISNLQRVMD